ncbi:MAG: arylamine N-acetyltransferase family protein [Betaproteobacteria bacterium]
MGGVDGFDLGAYLARIGLADEAATRLPGAGAATLATLTALHEAHVAAIPFENLDILLGRPIRLDLASLQAKLVGAGRGGYCFEHNTLFQAALESLGFRVTPLSARVRVGASGVRARTHMLLRVDLRQGPFLADVGFGAGGLVQPLPLAADGEARTGPFAYRLAREGELWVLQGNSGAGWVDQYAFTLEPQYPIDFEVANHYTSTHPQSAFVLNLTAQRSWRDRRAVLRNRGLVITTAAGDAATPIGDPDQLLEVLAREFGLVFPAGTRFSQPAF